MHAGLASHCLEQPFVLQRRKDSEEPKLLDRKLGMATRSNSIRVSPLFRWKTSTKLQTMRTSQLRNFRIQGYLDVQVLGRKLLDLDWHINARPIPFVYGDTVKVFALNKIEKNRTVPITVGENFKVRGEALCPLLAKCRPYMFLRYCPPTANNAFVICPSEQTRTASISTSNTLLLSITAR